MTTSFSCQEIELKLTQRLSLSQCLSAFQVFSIPLQQLMQSLKMSFHFYPYLPPIVIKRVRIAKINYKVNKEPHAKPE